MKFKVADELHQEHLQLEQTFGTMTQICEGIRVERYDLRESPANARSRAACKCQSTEC
jgi:hypothetical protein